MIPDLIVFDCDGVLIDSELIACGADADELSRLGYDITVEDVIRRFAGVPSDEMYAEVERELGRALPPDLDARIEQHVLQRYREDLNAIALVEETVAALPWRYCVVIEDSIAGVTAAKAAGMRVLGFVGGSHCAPGHGRELRDVGAELVFDSFDMLPAIVRELAERPS